MLIAYKKEEKQQTRTKIKGCVNCLNTETLYPTEERIIVHSTGSFKSSPAHIKDIKSRRVIPDHESFKAGFSGVWREKGRVKPIFVIWLFLQVAVNSVLAAPLSELRTDTRRLINETDNTNTHCTDTELNSWANMWQKDLGTFLDLPRKSTRIATTVDISTYALPTDFVYMLELFYNQNNAGGELKLEEVAQADLEKIYGRDWRQDASSDPYHYFFPGVESSTIEVVAVWPPPNSVNAGSNRIRGFYVSLPTTLSADSDEPQIPNVYHHTAQYYMAANCFFKIGDLPSYDRMFSIYSGLRDMYKQKIDRRQARVGTLEDERPRGR